MKVARWIVVVVVTLVSALGVAAKNVTVSGKVVDQDGKPVGGAVVSGTYTGDKITVSVISDPAGAFRLPLRNDALVVAWKKGYQNVSTQKISNGKPASAVLKMTSLPAVLPSQLSTSDIFANLPEDPAKKAFTTQCYACHGYSQELMRPRSKEEWAETVKRMSTVLAGSGVTTKNDQSGIVDYLAKYLGENSTLPLQIGEKTKKEDQPPVSIGHDIVITEYEVPTPVSFPDTAVPDERGNVFFTEFKGRKVGRLNIATGDINESSVDMPGVGPHGITVGLDGTPWFAGMPRIIGRIDPATTKVEEIPVPLGKNPAGPGVHTVLVAKSGLIYFTELGNHSISRYNPATKEFNRYDLAQNESAVGILEREPDIFWFALVFPGGVGRLDAKTGEIKRWYLATPDTRPNWIRFDQKGRIWLGEFGGNKLALFDPDIEKFSEYQMPYMCSPYSIHVDAKQNVWTECYDRDSLVKFDPNTKQVVEYPLPGVSAIVRDIWPDQTGRMWFSQWGRNKVTSVSVVP